MNTEVLLLIVGFFAISTVALIVYLFISKKDNAKKVNEANKRLLPIYNDPNIGRIALWITLDSVDGEPFDDSMVYYAKVKSNMTGMNQLVEVALFRPGSYTFVVSSREFSDVSMNVVIEAGLVYQLGANEDGPYFMLDSNGARYTMKEL